MKRLIVVLYLFLHAPTAWATEVQEVVSDHGIKAWLVEEHSVPMVAVKIAFTGSGYAYDNKGKEGLSNFMAAMFTEGAGDMDFRAFNEAIESHAISLTASVDDEYFHVSMESLSEHLETAFSYLGLSLTKPRFDKEALERTRRQLISLLNQQQENPGYRVWKAWQDAAFPGHPYSNPPGGVPESVTALSRDDLETYRAKHLTSENMIIAVVGDITPERLKRLLDENLSALPQDYAGEVTVTDTSVSAPPATAVNVDFNIPQTMVMFGLPGMKRSNPDFYAAYILNHILGGSSMLTSRLNKELREKRGLTYGLGMYMDPAKHAPVWRGQFSTRNEEAANALGILRTTMQHLAKQGATDEELEDAKKFITGSFVLNLDSNADIAGFLITMQAEHLGIDYLEKRNELMQAVTKETVNKTAKNLLDLSKLLVVTLGKPVSNEGANQP